MTWVGDAPEKRYVGLATQRDCAYICVQNQKRSDVVRKETIFVGVRLLIIFALIGYNQAANPAIGEPNMTAPGEKPPAHSNASTSSLDPLVSIAVQDLAQRLDISEDEIEILEVRKVVWPDASLGCPQPGTVYAQIQVDGLLIRLSAGGRMHFYHSGGTQQPFLCEETSQLVPKATPKVDEFIPPPGSEID